MQPTARLRKRCGLLPNADLPRTLWSSPRNVFELGSEFLLEVKRLTAVLVECPARSSIQTSGELAPAAMLTSFSSL